MSVIGINDPAASRSISLSEIKEKYGFWVGYFYTINCSIGSGILAMPWAFQTAGWILGLIILGITAMFSFTYLSFIIDSLSRSEVLGRL
jgi:amino acid permease